MSIKTATSSGFLKKHSLFFAAGMAMGLFALFPGASLAIFPFLFGIYELLFWQEGRTSSFFLVFFGFAVSLGIFFSLVSLLMQMPVVRVYAYSLITGITLTAVRLILKKIHYWKLSLFLFLSGGLLLASFALPQISKTGDRLSYFGPFLQGCTLAGSFFVPGLSIMNNLSFAFPSFLFFAFGTLIAWPAASFFLLRAWKNHREKTLSLFLGLLIGSLPSIWPYSPFIHFIHQETIIHLTNIQMVISFFFFLIGYFPIVWFHKWKKKKNERSCI